MKNTLLFLSVDGIGLNNKWKGNCLKLADKPNINYLISGIYPWATLSNAKKKSKINIKKEFDSVSTDIDKNFYQMLHGNKDVLTLNERIKEEVEKKTLINNPMFNDLVEHANISNSKYVHVFFLLSKNTHHCLIDNFKYILNILIKKGLKPVLHLIADGKDSFQYSFSNTLKEIEGYLVKRNIQIGTIVGRNNAFIQQGRDYKNSINVNKYFDVLCGMGDNSFTLAKNYAIQNLFDKVKDQDILPAYNSNIDKYYLDKNDAVLFIDSDYDNFSPLLHLIKSERKFIDLYIASTSPIYGYDVNSLMYSPYDSSMAITNIASQNDLKTLVISTSHKKGFLNKYYGYEKDENVTKKIIKTDYTKNSLDYIFSANKLIIDSAIKAIGKYDFIILHIPTIAEAAQESNLKLLKFAIENFDKNLGRLINYVKVTGNVMAFTSPYGICEKMLNKKLEINSNIKNSIVPFVFTNGDLSAKSLRSNFIGVYATLLVSLGIKNLDQEIYNRSLITRNYNMNIIHDKLADHYNVWKNELAVPVIEKFANEQLCLYSDIEKNKSYLEQKQQYVVIKEIIKLHERLFTTPEARKLIFDKLLHYVSYNGIDFEGFKYNYSKLLMTLFDDEIKLSKLSSFTYRFFDNRLWKTQIKRNDKWFNKVKNEILPSLDRSMPESSVKKIVNYLNVNIEPYQYFERLFQSEKDVLLTNDAEKIVDFYINVKDEVGSIYQEYFGSRVPAEDEEQVFEDANDNVLANPDFNKIVSYYEAFLEVIDLVEESKDKAHAFNVKYLENQKILKNKKEITDVFEAEQYMLNYLVRKIVSIYQQWKRKVNSFNRDAVKSLVQTMNKYDNKYGKRVNTALLGISYEGEFFEDLDLDSQEYFESLVNEKVREDGFFDYPSIDVNDHNDDEYVSPLLEDIDPLVLKEVDQIISTRSAYDLTTIWNKKRHDEIKNIENISQNFTLDAENMVIDERKFRESRSKVKEYSNLSNVWYKKISNKESDL